MARIDELFRLVKQTKASDLHMLEGLPPKIRVHGDLQIVADHPVLTEPMLRQYLSEITTPRQWQRYEESGDLDFAYGLEGVARFRCNYLRQVMGRGAVFRQIPDKIVTAEELNLPEAVANLAHLRSGLVLVTGPTGSGKSTTLAAVLNIVNRAYKKHLITIEDPIEFVHENIKSVITQREVGQHSEGFASALRAAVREDPDVILVGEMRDLETISLALTAAELGLLVFGTLHTNSAAKTIDRVIDVFPAGRQPMIRTMLSESIQAIVSQLLLKKIGGGRVACFEILVRREGLSNMIREGAISKISSMIETGKQDGMQLMDQGLMDLYKRKIITGEDAYMKAFTKRSFEHLRSAGVFEEKGEDDDAVELDKA
ncbi:MAG: type IV pilus twitching motility protein PilT [Phycisphaeraceae bacterium]|nr:type IV pilus twitching motility protein PilT [Phycisphaeraceae bacterium]